MIEVDRLTKDYGPVVAVQDLSFRVARGEVVGFLGPNGAGKSTTLRMLTGFLGATSGSVRIQGHNVFEQPLAARRALGYLPETTPLYPELRVEEYLGFRASLKSVPRRQRRDRVRAAMELAGVTEMADTLILHLSRGYRQRVGLADALVANPPLLILDEPTAGLDPNQIREVRNLIRELGREHTILLSTHILSEVETTCDRALVIHRGRLVGEGTIDQLRAQRGDVGVSLLLRDPEGVASRLVEGIRGVRAARVGEAKEGLLRLQIEFKDGDSSRIQERLVVELVSAGVGIREVVPRRASLEEVFAALTQEDPGTSAYKEGSK